MARLLTTLLLHQAGYDVGRFISLERIAEETKDGYYGSLRKSSAGWHGGEHSLVPWWEYFLGVMLLQAYRRLEARLAGRTVPGTTKADMVAKVVSNLPSIFAYSDIANACPGVSRPTIMLALTGLREQGLIVCTRKGRNALWRKCDHGAQE